MTPEGTVKLVVPTDVKVWVSVTALTVRVKASFALAVPSLTVMVMVAEPF